MGEEAEKARGGAQKLHIALTFNDKYWALAYTVMRSICLTSNRKQDLVFHLCHTTMTPSHGTVLERIRTEFGANLAHYDPEQTQAFRDLVALLPSTDRFPPIVYTRLVLDRILPADIERVLYLDCDVMVVEAIETLFETDLGGNVLAAALDPYHLGIKMGRDVNSGRKPFLSADPYFNSGVLLIDRKAYAAADIPATLADLARKGELKNLYFDQDLLNLLFRHRWLRLNWRYNLTRPRRIHEPLNPVIIHYTENAHPWALFSRAAYARLYRHVMSNEVFYWQLRDRWKRHWLLRPFRHLLPQPRP